MKRFFTKALALVLIAASPSLSHATIRLYLNPTRTNMMSIGMPCDNRNYSIVTTGEDPYCYSTGLSRDLEDGESVLSFDYTAPEGVGDLQIYLGYPASSEYSVTFPLEPSEGKATFSLDLADMMKRCGFGKKADILRIDFGNSSGLSIDIENLKIKMADEADDILTEETQPTLASVLALGLPVLDINTVDGIEPSCEMISAPPGCNGTGITNAEKINGSIRRLETDGSISYDSGEYDGDDAGMTIKVRGNTSGLQVRKPFKVKLQKKGDLLVRGDNKFNDKNWVLLNDYEMKLRNGMWMNDVMGLDWAPACEYVNIVINGFYRGVYLLCEAVERNTDCRIDVSKTGFVAELDAYWWNENGEYLPSVWSPDWNYTLKYPDFEDTDEAQRNSISGFLSVFEDSMEDDTFDRHIDCESLARWIMGHDILGTYDSRGSNIYFSRYDDEEESLLRCPLMWDFDATEELPDTWSNIHIQHYQKLFDSENTALLDAYCRTWETTGQYAFGNMIKRLDAFMRSPEAKAYDSSMELTTIQWGQPHDLAGDCSARSIRWYTDRYHWMKTNVGDLSEGLAVEELPAGEGGITVSGRTVSCGGEAFDVFTPEGILTASSRGESVELPSGGIYILRISRNTARIIVR